MPVPRTTVGCARGTHVLLAVLACAALAGAELVVFDAEGVAVKSTSAPASFFGPSSFNVTLPALEVGFTKHCKGARLQDQIVVPAQGTEVAAVVRLQDAIGSRCGKFTTLYDRLSRLMADHRLVLGAVVFVRAFSGPPEAQANFPTLVPGTLWILKDDTCDQCAMERVPSVTVRKESLDGLIQSGTTVRLVSGDESEWEAFYESTGGLAWRFSLVSWYATLLLWSFVGLYVDHRRHGNRLKTLFTNIPEATQLTIALALIGCVLVQSPDPMDPFMNRLEHMVLYDVPYYLGVYSLMIFFTTWDLMVRAFDKSRPDLEDASRQVYGRFRIVSAFHVLCCVCAVACRIAFPDATSNRLVSNVQYSYCGLIVVVTTARVVFLGRRLNRLVRRGSWEEKRTDGRPFIRMQRLARRLGLAAGIVTVAVMTALFYTDRFALFWHVLFQTAEAGVFGALVVLIFYHLHVARTNIGKNMDARPSLTPQ